MDHAQKLMQAGVFTELYVEPGVPHSYDSLAGTPQTERIAKMRDNATRRMLGIKEEPKPADEGIKFSDIIKYFFGT